MERPLQACMMTIPPLRRGRPRGVRPQVAPPRMESQMAREKSVVSIETSNDFNHLVVKVTGFMDTLVDVRAFPTLIQRQMTALGCSNTIRDCFAGVKGDARKANMAIQRRLATLRAGAWKADDVSGNWADFVAALVVCLAADKGLTLTDEQVNDKLSGMKPEQIRAFRSRADVDAEMKRIVAERAAAAVTGETMADAAALDAFA